MRERARQVSRDLAKSSPARVRDILRLGLVPLLG